MVLGLRKGNVSCAFSSDSALSPDTPCAPAYGSQGCPSARILENSLSDPITKIFLDQFGQQVNHISIISRFWLVMQATMTHSSTAAGSLFAGLMIFNQVVAQPPALSRDYNLFSSTPSSGYCRCSGLRTSYSGVGSSLSDP